MFVNQGDVHNAVLPVGVESDKESDGHPVVLDGQLHPEGVSEPTDVGVRRHAPAENHRKHKSVRLEIRSAHGTEDSPPLLRDRLSGVYVDVAHLRLY